MLGGLFRRGDAIDVTEAHRRLEAGELVLVDVREKPEWRGGRATRARHVPLTSLPRQLGALGAETAPIAFICRSGHRSAAACATARSHGIVAINVTGGMAAWQRAGLPVTRG